MFKGGPATQGYRGGKILDKVKELSYFKPAKGLFADSTLLSAYKLHGSLPARVKQLAAQLKGQQFILKH